MKPLTDLDHYEVLDILRGSSPEGVARAYQLSMATYADDSMAGYSVFEPGDAAAMRLRIETAYLVLADVDAMLAFDWPLAAVIPGVPKSAEPPPSHPSP